MERGTSCYKDLGTYVAEDCGNLSESLPKIAQNVCMQFYLDDRLALQEPTTQNEVGFASKKSSLILWVGRFDMFVDQDGKHSNGYPTLTKLPLRMVLIVKPLSIFFFHARSIALEKCRRFEPDHREARPVRSAQLRQQSIAVQD